LLLEVRLEVGSVKYTSYIKPLRHIY